MLDKLAKEMLEKADCGCGKDSQGIKTVTETPISNNTTRSAKPVDELDQRVKYAVNTIRSKAKTEYPNLSASFKAYVNFNKLPTEERNMVFSELFGE